MFKFIKSLFSIKKESESGSVAKKRLQTVISRDRANISADFLLNLKNDLIELASKYIESDYKQISITIERGESGNAFLQARFPVISYKEQATVLLN